jgi:TetR/AcrR family transcriptional repressor of nem operon
MPAKLFRQRKSLFVQGILRPSQISSFLMTTNIYCINDEYHLLSEPIILRMTDMPRVSKEQTDLNRAAIENVSARLFREKGLNGVSVADLMSAAGLTHGGFYGHFSSKDELAAVACANAFAQSATRWEKRIEEQPDDRAAQKVLIDGYLSPKNLLNIGNACPAMSMVGDVARESPDKPVRAAFAAGVSELTEILASIAASDDAAERRKTALTQLSTMVGAMLLARATSEDPLSAEILTAVRESLHDSIAA